ncbi:GNAT family N-acetyltransferase [Mangrovicoccus sp. HB161399]|uniref:GNAT family N-acetyltransferase n=1 Tax=Mangrovicoccus sp. HB161399 TaxID=2720392 RepID=UPI001556E1B2|nr:GNAT family N-acetyltransferase [Mangrovicoccus sp. HB161399]
MSMTLTVRPLASGDRPDWDRLWTAYLAFYGTTRPKEVFDATFARLLGDAPQHGLIALSGGQPAGLVHYLYHAHNWHIAPVCYLQDLYADPEVRGQGVGRALIEAVYAAADAAGAADTYWMTQESNATARQLYDRIGQVTPFIKYSRGPKA